jgi:hypothetical protein
MTDILSPYVYVGHETSTPIICSLYLNPLTGSIPFFKATNSAPKTDDSIVGCLLDYHVIKAPLNDKITCPRPHGSLVTCVIRINKQTNVYILTSWGWRIWWDCFLYVPIILLPIAFLEITHVDLWVSWIKDKSGIVLLFQIGKHMKDSVKLSSLRCRNT